jgi:hypothetical protein
MEIAGSCFDTILLKKQRCFTIQIWMPAFCGYFCPDIPSQGFRNQCLAIQCGIVVIKLSKILKENKYKIIKRIKIILSAKSLCDLLSGLP